jgi:hypothetical protein
MRARLKATAQALAAEQDSELAAALERADAVIRGRQGV